MSAEDAMRKMAAVTSNTRGLRVRTEGLTLVVFAICMMASYLTIVVPILFGGEAPRPDFDGNATFNRTFNDTFNGTFEGGRGGGGRSHGPPPTAFFLSAYAPLAWYVIAVVVTIAIWRSASLSFQTGVSTPRLLGVLVGWMLIFVTVVVLLAYVEGGSPRSWHLLAWGVVIGLFAALNPLRFTTPGRVAAAVVGASALLTAAYAYAVDLGPRDLGFLSGVALGVPGLVAGLWLMFRG
jgi:hypothetical protein